MSATDVLRNNELITEELFLYTERAIDDEYTAVEIWRNDQLALFREFYFIVNVVSEKVYLADYTAPVPAFTAAIKSGNVPEFVAAPATA